MRTELCDKLGIEYPIFAFTHCRDVVAAVSNAGGLGVLGAVGFTANELEDNLKWIDEHVGDNPYAVDMVIPSKYEGKGQDMSAEALEKVLLDMVPQGHRDFAKKLLADAGVPELPEGTQVPQLLGWTEATAGPLVETALKHEKVALIANALGTPPADVVKDVKDAGRMVAALCGSVKHALKHKEAGIDILVCQGMEGGGHTGDVGSIVLWPEVIAAVDPLPVLAAGGIGSGRQMAAAMAMGAAGVWSGSLWLTVTESDWPEESKQSYLNATSRDTVRTRAWTGKPARFLRNDWSDAWDAADTPDPLGLPLQFMVTAEAVVRGNTYAAKAQKVAFNPAGQIIGSVNTVKPARLVIQAMVEDYLDAVERLNDRMPEQTIMED
ncbi:MAG: nitronate monooxygenase [Deltaproteobacteria bacterium]|nr:nitronate monooxygenase [Deltaproteobacteria bacterium]